ncbi:MAG TPA: nucleotide-binding protein [Bryobacteraceae bacterium]|nr:nucleotide-binding protein [Bryobacteraceae bacterium]
MVKPRIFIGSSGDARNYAAAIHSLLMRMAECTVWTEGVFGLSESILQELMHHLHDSDFGVFVFAPDDTAEIKGEFLTVPRDNVVYEAGLFSGYLTPQRCFVVIPLERKVHLPTDLLGMTVGFYEDQRRDRKFKSAVASFCSDVEDQIKRQGLFDGHFEPRLRELALQFECCDFIPDGADPTDPSKERIAKKREVGKEITTYCHDHVVNKHRLLGMQRHGYAYVLLAAIIERPEDGDDDILKQIESKALPPVFTQFKVVETIEALNRAKLIRKAQGEELKKWAMALPGLTTDLKTRIERAIT